MIKTPFKIIIFTVFHSLCAIHITCIAQKKQIKKIKLDTTLVEKIQKDSLIQLLYLNDYDFEDKTAGLKIVVNQRGRYQYEDSTLVNAVTKIYLHTTHDLNKNKTSDYEKAPILYGFLKGKIINGKKEGEWIKKIINNKKDYVTVKVLNYSSGVLNGEYKVYSTKGNILYPFELHPSYPEEYKDYVIFKEGTGIYYDYYYNTGILKVKGAYIKSKKNGAWNYYDKNGNKLHTEYYKNGVLIN